MDDLCICIRISVGPVLSYLTECLPIRELDHTFIVDEFLADLFLNYQSRFNEHSGPHAVVHRNNCGHYYSHETFQEVFIQARNILMELICSIWPDYRPGADKAAYHYHGGENLLVYMPYDSEKHSYIPRTALVPWNAVANSRTRT